MIKLESRYSAASLVSIFSLENFGGLLARNFHAEDWWPFPSPLPLVSPPMRIQIQDSFYCSVMHPTVNAKEKQTPRSRLAPANSGMRKGWSPAMPVGWRSPARRSSTLLAANTCEHSPTRPFSSSSYFLSQPLAELNLADHGGARSGDLAGHGELDPPAMEILIGCGPPLTTPTAPHVPPRHAPSQRLRFAPSSTRDLFFCLLLRWASKFAARFASAVGGRLGEAQFIFYSPYGTRFSEKELFSPLPTKRFSSVAVSLSQ